MREYGCDRKGFYKVNFINHRRKIKFSGTKKGYNNMKHVIWKQG